MEFVSKDQTYEALRKLLLENAAHLGDVQLENLARDMQMEGDRSRNPDLYKNFLNDIQSDPLEPQTALDAAAQFMEENASDGAKPEVARFIESAKVTARDPEKGDLPLWNHWIELLESV